MTNLEASASWCIFFIATRRNRTNPLCSGFSIRFGGLHLSLRGLCWRQAGTAARCTPTLSPRCPINPCSGVGCNSTLLRRKIRKRYSYPKPSRRPKTTLRLRKSRPRNPNPRNPSPRSPRNPSPQNSNPQPLPASRSSSRKSFGNLSRKRRRSHPALRLENQNHPPALCRISAPQKIRLGFVSRPPGLKLHRCRLHQSE